MLGDSITINLGGSGGTARVLNKINQDGYSAEYFDRTSTDEIRMFVRHSTENYKPTGVTRDRHNVEITRRIFATASVPEINVRFYFVMSHEAHYDEDSYVDLVEGIHEWMTAPNLGKVLEWQS